MKTIVLMIDNLLGAGAQRSTIKIATAFLKRDYKVIIISMVNIVEFEIDDRIEIKFLDFKKGTISYLSYIKYAKKLKNMLLDIEQKYTKIDFLAGSLGLTHKFMDMLSLDDAYYMLRGSTSHAKIGNREGIKKSIKTKKVKKLYDNKHLLCVSKGVEEDILSIGVIPKSINTIYNPYVFEDIRNLALMDIDYRVDGDYLVHVGSFSQPKRHDILLTAFSKIEDKTVKLVLVGAGEEEQSIKRLIDNLEIKNRVIFAGFHSNPYPIIKNAKLLLLSSDHEGLPTVLIEALALGVKVVSTDCPSGPYEILAPEFKNYLVPTGDVKAFAKKIDEALSEDEVDIPQSLLKPFDEDKVIKQYERLFS
jgi:glycosyltransferase involved in cell wall biosynthesis